MAQEQDNENELEIRLRRYSAVREDSYYHELGVGPDGHLCARQRLTRRQLDFLEKIGADITLWDGKRGLYGVAYTGAGGLVPPEPTCLTLSHARQLNDQLLRENRRVPLPNATAALNTRLVLQERDNVGASEDSLVQEARKRALAGQQHNKAAEWYETFARPALLATAATHVPACAQREHDAYVAARARTFGALRAYSDACEAVHVLHEMEHGLGVSVRETRGTKRTATTSILENMVKTMETDGYVACALRAAGYGELTTWALAMSELPDVLRQKKARDKYVRLPKIYKDVGRCYDAVKMWKAELAPFLQHAAALERDRLTALWAAWDEVVQL